MNPEESLQRIVDQLGTLAALVGIREEEMIVVRDTAVAESIEAGIGRQGDLNKESVGCKAVDKRAWAVCTVLVRTIHNLPLVNHHEGLEEEHTENHSVTTELAQEEKEWNLGEFTYAPGLCPIGLPLCIPSIGVLSPLLRPPPPAACSAFRALCSANLFFRSEEASNLGFFG